ncbi:MAG: DUF6174 domain-containing protein [Pseudomonadota bacterium]
MPKEILEIRSTVQYVCNPRVADAGTACEDGSECRGDCIASTDALPGQETIGACAAYALRTLGSMTLTNGKAVYPLKLDFLENRQVALRLEYELAKARWDALEIDTYRIEVEQSCFCLYGPYYGPNQIFVRNGTTRRVTYLGETRDGFQSGDSLTNEDAFKPTVNDLFAYVGDEIRGLGPDRVLSVNYHPEFGFPVRTERDDLRLSDSNVKITVIDFLDR